MKRIIFLLISFCCASLNMVVAQDDVQSRARRIYDFLVAGQGDSIYTSLNADLQTRLSPADFSGMLPQVERQFGKLQQAGEWQTTRMQNVDFCYRDMMFEKYTLRFFLGFDADGALNTIRLMPAPAPAAPTAPVASDTTAFVEQEVTVGTADFPLPGTLMLPKSVAGRVPCVVLVHGSGPQDRDETVGPNKPFRDLAHGLAALGIATLRYDKRTRVYGAACLPEGRQLDMDVETCDDALAAVDFARSHPRVAADSVFVLGHSQGGTMAPRIALRSEGSVAGIVILAGLARPLEDALLDQTTYLSGLSGSSDDGQLEAIKRQVANVKRLGTAEFCDTIPLPLSLPESYWKFLQHCHPVEEAAALACPVLVLQGERDYQVTMQDYGLWRAALLSKSGAQCKSYPALNHLLQEGKGKSAPWEYYNESRPVPAYVCRDIAGFLRGQDIR